MQRCNISIWQEVWLIVPSFYRDSESGMRLGLKRWCHARQGSCRCNCVLLIPSYQIYKEYIDNDGAMDEETRGVSTFLSRRLLWKQFSIRLSGVSCLRCPVQVSLHFAASTSSNSSFAGRGLESSGLMPQNISGDCGIKVDYNALREIWELSRFHGHLFV